MLMGKSKERRTRKFSPSSTVKNMERYRRYFYFTLIFLNNLVVLENIFFEDRKFLFQAECRNCIAHSSHVTCVRFMYDDTRMISVGGKDCSVMQWRIT